MRSGLAIYSRKIQDSRSDHCFYGVAEKPSGKRSTFFAVINQISSPS